MEKSQALIIGSSFSGLASAASLRKENIEFTIIEKSQQVATPWRNHYQRLHLHTNKRISSLPFKKFAPGVPRYPTRQQVVDYLDDYHRAFNIRPLFNTEAMSVRKEGSAWVTETNNGTFKSNYVIVATGPFGKPKPIRIKGMEKFPGKILHSSDYKTGKDFKGQKVLVIGFGNSACEIAIDLHEQGAMPAMSVRSPINVIPRDLLGIPILEVSQIMSRLPPRLADTINAPVMKLLFGNLKKFGLKKMPYGPFEQIQKDGTIPVLDIGTIRHIKKGNIRIHDEIDHIQGKTIHFVDEREEEFDTIVAGIGYYRDYAEWIKVEHDRFEDLKLPAARQKYFGKDGLYFCGFWVAPTGQIREISLDAQRIAKDIATNDRGSP